MIFRQVFDNKSSTYTYLIASAKGREAVIIDPVIENVQSYIELLNELDLKLIKSRILKITLKENLKPLLLIFCLKTQPKKLN